MRSLGAVLPVLGVLAIILALVNHNHAFVHTSHGSAIIGVFGVVLLVMGGFALANEHRGHI
jgi:hypothetical protein